MSEKAQQVIQNAVNTIIQRQIDFGEEPGDLSIEAAVGQVVRAFPASMGKIYTSEALEQVRTYARELLVKAIEAA